MNYWSHSMQQHAAHGVRAESSQLPTRPGLWPPTPEETKGNLRGLQFLEPAGHAGYLQTPRRRQKGHCVQVQTRAGTVRTPIGIEDHSGWVAGSHLPEMIVQESSHDRFCSEKSSCKAPSCVLISESASAGCSATSGGLRHRLKWFLHAWVWVKRKSAAT